MANCVAALSVIAAAQIGYESQNFPSKSQAIGSGGNRDGFVKGTQPNLKLPAIVFIHSSFFLI